MWTDVIDLRDFYQTNLGRVTQKVIRDRIRALWNHTEGMRILGLGFPTPFFDPFNGACERVVALMPAYQGVLPWPAPEMVLTTLGDEQALPFPDRCFDRILLVHILESANDVRPLMREIWRVLSDSGRIIVVVPNRRGIWARLDRTPFGTGTPYTAGQITHLLRETMFTPLHVTGALQIPPTTSPLILSWGPAWEEIGTRWFPAFSGVLLAEAAKQIYATRLARDGKRALRHSIGLAINYKQSVNGLIDTNNPKT